MKPRFFASILVLSTLLTLPTGAVAASESTGSRYFLDSDSGFWRGMMGARHVFTDGFTAELSDVQLGVAKLMGLKPVPVQVFNILSEDTPPSPTPTPQMVPSQSVPWGVRAMLGDNELRQTEGGAGIRIALLDTGIALTHPDLTRRVDGCYDLTDIARGFVDGVCDDLNGHGTHMAGIMVADGGADGTGSYGFAPRASISAYRVCTNGGACLSDDIAAAITHASDAGANIIVLGMGGESRSSLVSDAIAYAHEHGALVVAGAGNDGPYEDSIDWPARDPIVVSVGAIDNADEPAEFSSRGLNTTGEPFTATEGDIELAAPGVNIESTYLAGGYAILSGTSMAAPHVAGLAALLWQSDAEDPAQATREQLHTLARDIADAGDDDATGWGMPTMPR